MCLLGIFDVFDPQRFDGILQQRHDGPLVVALEDDSVVSQPENVSGEPLYRIEVRVDAFLGYYMCKRAF